MSKSLIVDHEEEPKTFRLRALFINGCSSCIFAVRDRKSKSGYSCSCEKIQNESVEINEFPLLPIPERCVVLGDVPADFCPLDEIEAPYEWFLESKTLPIKLLRFGRVI
jgi:hypothetical protein